MRLTNRLPIASSYWGFSAGHLAVAFINPDARALCYRVVDLEWRGFSRFRAVFFGAIFFDRPECARTCDVLCLYAGQYWFHDRSSHRYTHCPDQFVQYFPGCRYFHCPGLDRALDRLSSEGRRVRFFQLI